MIKIFRENYLEMICTDISPFQVSRILSLVIKLGMEPAVAGNNKMQE